MSFIHRDIAVAGAGFDASASLERVELQGLYGLDEGWRMPTALWWAPVGFERLPVSEPVALAAMRRHRADIVVWRTQAKLRGRPRSDFALSVQLHVPLDGKDEGTGFGHAYLQADFIRMVANEAFGQDINLHIDHALVPNPILERRLDDYLGRATDQRDTPSTMEMDARAVLIGIELLRNHSVRPLRPPQHGGLAPWQVRKVSDFIEANLARDVPLAELASLIRLSPYHFCRAFGRSTGLPPHRWLQARRIEAAKLHLARDDRTILEIAAMVGYDNPGHFAKVFRRLVGVTPREFRRRS